jgi:hypothetical protein
MMVKPPGSHYTVVLFSGTLIFPLPDTVILSAAKDLRSSSQVAKKKNNRRDPSLRSG